MTSTVVVASTIVVVDRSRMIPSAIIPAASVPIPSKGCLGRQGDDNKKQGRKNLHLVSSLDVMARSVPMLRKYFLNNCKYHYTPKIEKSQVKLLYYGLNEALYKINGIYHGASSRH